MDVRGLVLGSVATFALGWSAIGYAEARSAGLIAFAAGLLLLAIELVATVASTAIPIAVWRTS
ncbi:MAG: hypothetical protein FJ029_01295 [Actinobacteria bacterium]|nr:hypothetical protein [Actinomycetota bacterium]